jgi:hypothetical protein
VLSNARAALKLAGDDAPGKVGVVRDKAPEKPTLWEKVKHLATEAGADLENVAGQVVNTLASVGNAAIHHPGTVASVIGAEQAGRDQRVQQEMDGLQQQLGAGNMNPGLGTKSLSGTDVYYARGRNGARLVFRNVDGGIQIVGKADKGNESAVIGRLQKLYGN